MTARISLWWLLACLVCCVCRVPVSAQQERPPFEFGEAAEPVSWQAGEEAKVQVLNNTTRPLTLSVKLVDSPAKGGQQLSSVVDFDAKLPIPPADEGTIVLRVKADASLQPGSTISGYLVVADDASGTVKRRTVNLSTPKKAGETPAPVALKPLVGSLKATVCYWPEILCKPDNGVYILDSRLPLQPKDKQEKPKDKQEDIKRTFKPDAPLAWLANEDGETALVTFARAEELPGGVAGIVLGLKEPEAAAEYKGNLPEMIADDNKPVALTIKTTHHWLLPALALLAGIALYYLMQWYLNVLRKVLGLQEQEAELGVALTKAEADFKTAANGKPYAMDSIRSDFVAQSSAQRKNIRGLLKKNFLKLDETSEAHKNIVAKLAELKGVVERWATFAGSRLNVLSDALVVSRPDFNKRPTNLPTNAVEPEVASQAATELDAAGDSSIAQFNERSARVDELLPSLRAWRGLNERAATISEKFAQIMNAANFAQRSEATKTDVESKRNEALLIWHTLWTTAPFDAKALREQLNALDNAYAAHAGLPASASHAAVSASTAASTAGAADEWEIRELSPADRLNLIGRGRLLLDLFHLALAVVVALYFGLNQLYVGKAFGTPMDYLAVFFYGLGTKAMIDVVAGAINKFTSRGA